MKKKAVKKGVQTIEGLAALVAEEFAVVHERFDAIDKRFDKVDAQLANLEIRVAALEMKVSGIQRRLDEEAMQRIDVRSLIARITTLEDLVFKRK